MPMLSLTRLRGWKTLLRRLSGALLIHNISFQIISQHFIDPSSKIIELEEDSSSQTSSTPGARMKPSHDHLATLSSEESQGMICIILVLKVVNRN